MPKSDENKISSADRGTLIASEREALAQQHRNRDQSRGTPAEVVQRQAAKAADMHLKTPKRDVYGG
jgi:hypothetical protein